MKHIQTFENFLNESKDRGDMYSVTKYTNGREIVTHIGYLQALKNGFPNKDKVQMEWQELSDKHPDFKGREPENIEDVITLLNFAEELKAKSKKSKSIWKLTKTFSR